MTCAIPAGPRCRWRPPSAGWSCPAVVYCVITVGAGDGAAGWAIPTATDIAFALAVLAVIGRFLPAALRTFLLTLAVVDDLLAIMIIAVFYTARPVRRCRCWARCCRSPPSRCWCSAGSGPGGCCCRWPPLTWALVHASGVHATVAGVLLAFTVPVVRSAAAGGPNAGPGLAEHFEHRFRPISAGIAVPVFAFFSAGVTVGGLAGLATALTDPVAVGIVVGLVIGKPVGILAATWLVSRFTRADLDEGLTWLDVFGSSVLGGIGFTVSLLIGELAFGLGSERDDHVKVAVLAGSLLVGAAGRGHPAAAEPRLPAGARGGDASTSTGTACRTSSRRKWSGPPGGDPTAGSMSAHPAAMISAIRGAPGSLVGTVLARAPEGVAVLLLCFAAVLLAGGAGVRAGQPDDPVHRRAVPGRRVPARRGHRRRPRPAGRLTDRGARWPSWRCSRCCSPTGCGSAGPTCARRGGCPGRALGWGLPLTLLGHGGGGALVAGLGWAESLLIGAILAPTDPVFAAALVGNDKVPARLRHLLNVESGVNDGLALPFVVVLPRRRGRLRRPAPG